MQSVQQRIPWSQVAAGTAVVAVTYGMARFGVGLAAPRIIEQGVVNAAGFGFGSALS